MFFFDKLFKLIQEDTVVITANKRLALRIIDEVRTLNSKRIKVLSLDDYLKQCWQQNSVLLNTNQERTLWEHILKDSDEDHLLHISATAYSSQQAWKLLKQWNIPLEMLQDYETAEVQNFLKWVLSFSDQCQKSKWLDQANLLEVVRQNFQSDELIVPAHIILVGFLELAPAIETFIRNLQELGCRVENYEREEKTSLARRISCQDAEIEIYTMARWAKKILEKHEDPFIICAVPNLNQVRRKIKRIFNEVFETNDLNAPFNISVGNPLREEPIINAAFEILALKINELSIQEVGYLLRSPFIGHRSEYFSEMALLDAKIRAFGCTHYRLSDLIQLLSDKEDCTKELYDQLKQLEAVSIHEKQSPSMWANTFTNILDIMKWPGDRTLNDYETQLVQRFKDLFTEFAELDFIEPKISYTQAISRLHRLAAQTTFQPERKKVSIHILGLLEAVGQPCTNIWMMGLDEHRFPAPVEPNPLLPISLQRQYHMPHSNAERELHFSRLVMQQILADSEEVVFSYARQENDQILQASSLIQSFPETEIELCEFTSQAEKIANTQPFIEAAEDQAPPISPEEIVRGGTDIFKQQAACPFRAFAKHRLHAKPLEEPEEGLSTLEHGLLVHKILEYFWEKVHTQKKLLELTEDELKDTIKTCIQRTIYRIASKKHFSNNILQIEKTCLEKLIMNWLLQEKERSNPFDVIACEKWRETKIGNLTIKMQIDRIDHFEDNSHGLIDYKTGWTSIQSWFGDRPDEPQLPLYAVSADEPVSAIAFAQINPSEMKFKSIGDKKDLFPQGKKLEEKQIEITEAAWQQQIDRWRETLEQLADDFCQGNAKVDPKNPKQTCQYCEFKSLCRIFG